MVISTWKEFSTSANITSLTNGLFTPLHSVTCTEYFWSVRAVIIAYSWVNIKILHRTFKRRIAAREFCSFNRHHETNGDLHILQFNIQLIQDHSAIYRKKVTVRASSTVKDRKIVSPPTIVLRSREDSRFKTHSVCRVESEKSLLDDLFQLIRFLFIFVLVITTLYLDRHISRSYSRCELSCSTKIPGFSGKDFVAES